MPVPPPPFEARLVRTRALTPNVRELGFERVAGQPMAFEPGQWVNVDLLVAEGAPVRRSYSIASAPDGSPYFEIAVTLVQGGPGSSWLHGVEPGVVLTFLGPHGFFTRPKIGPASLFVATGTGVTPMRSMARAALAAGAREPMWFLLGVRHEDDALYSDELTALARDHDFIRFEPTLSQPRGPWPGRRGYVQAHVKELWAELRAQGAGEPHAYICGLERMVGSVRTIFREEMGLPRQQVHSERYD